MKKLIALSLVVFAQSAFAYGPELMDLAQERTSDAVWSPIHLSGNLPEPGKARTPDRTIPPVKILVRLSIPGEERTIEIPVPPVRLAVEPFGVGPAKDEWTQPPFTLGEATDIILNSDVEFVTAEGVDITEQVLSLAEYAESMEEIESFQMADAGDMAATVKLKAYAKGVHMAEEQL